MLKKLIVTVALMGVAASSYGQGTVNFDTKIPLAQVLVKSKSAVGAGVAPADGTNYLTQLYAAAGVGASESSLQPVGNPVNLRGGSNAGYSQTSGQTTLGTTVNKTVAVTSVDGGPATVQLRAWTAKDGTYDAAAAAFLADVTAGSGAGKSALLDLASTGNPNLSPPGLPVNLVGLQGFTMSLSEGVIVPEPTTVALSVLGAGALLIAARRRK